MKRNIFKSFATLVVLVFTIGCFVSCSDDLDGCGLTVVVKDALTGERVSGASIHISKNAGTITRDGVSDNNGEAYFFFDQEAIFDINVSYGEAPYTKTGLSTVRLKDDKVVTKDVLIQ